MTLAVGLKKQYRKKQYRAWDERAQAVNDAGIAACDVMLVLSPSGIPTEGTDEEVAYAERVGTPVMYVPPGSDITMYGVKELLTSIQGVINASKA